MLAFFKPYVPLSRSLCVRVNSRMSMRSLLQQWTAKELMSAEDCHNPVLGETDRNLGELTRRGSVERADRDAQVAQILRESSGLHS